MSSITLTVLYFGALRDAAGIEREPRMTAASDLRSLWDECAAAHGLQRAGTSVRVAVDGEFATWSDRPKAASEVAFMPPFTGG